MKINFLLIIFILSLSSIKAQTFNSSCVGNANLEIIYRNDAAYQAMLRTNTIGSAYKDSLELDPVLTDSILQAFYAIHNVQGQLWRDTIVTLFGYSNFGSYKTDSLHGIAQSYIDNNYNNYKSCKRLMITVYDTVPWVNAWINGNYNNTDNDSINSLVNRFDFTIKETYNIKLYKDRTIYTLTANRPINMPALIQYIGGITGVSEATAETLLPTYSATRIELQFIDGNIIIAHGMGCGDCPSGCTYGRNWRFKVNLSTDCSVVYLSVSNWGMMMPGMNVQDCIGPVVPVQFNEVKAISKDGYRIVQWRVETETDVQRYIVERSADGINYSAIGEQQPQNSGTAAQYNFADAELMDGNFYYRVKMISRSGEAKYSAVARLSTGSNAFIRVYPTVINNRMLTVQFNKVPKGMYKATLSTMSGQQIFATQLSVISDRQTQTLQLPALNQNCYILTVGNHEMKVVQKVIR